MRIRVTPDEALRQLLLDFSEVINFTIKLYPLLVKNQVFWWSISRSSMMSLHYILFPAADPYYSTMYTLF